MWGERGGIGNFGLEIIVEDLVFIEWLAQRYADLAAYLSWVVHLKSEDRYHIEEAVTNV